MRNTTSIGVFAGPGSAGVAQLDKYATWCSKPAEWVTENFNQSTQDAMASGAAWSIDCYKVVKDTVGLTFSIPMLWDDHSGTLEQGASGAFDHLFTAIASNLATAGFNECVLRIGWEMNGDWQPWAAARNPEAWIAYYRRIVKLIRAASPGAKFLFDWCPNIGQGLNADFTTPAGKIPADLVYPGDDVVDIIGLDVYDAVYNPPNDSVRSQRWNTYITIPFGLQWQIEFASNHHKLLSLPEWGVGGNNSGDNDLFINNMFRLIRDLDYRYAVYWDSNANYQGQLSLNQWPNAAKAYIANVNQE